MLCNLVIGSKFYNDWMDQSTYVQEINIKFNRVNSLPYNGIQLDMIGSIRLLSVSA